MTDTCLCDCHGEPMYAVRAPKYRWGIRWDCSVKRREAAAYYRMINPPTKEERAEKSRKYRDAHPEYDREWRERNKDRVNAQNRAYQSRRHPDKARETVERRRARRLGLPADNHTRQEIWERDGGRCVYCGGEADPAKWHIAHLIALADPRPDNPGTVRSNVAVSHPTCNLRAGAKPVAAA